MSQCIGIHFKLCKISISYPFYLLFSISNDYKFEKKEVLQKEVSIILLILI